MAAIQRSVMLDAPAGDVWKAISDEAMLGEWLAADVELDLRPRGAIRCRTEVGEERQGEVELVEEGERLAFHWQRDGAERSRVELSIEEVSGGTRLTVTESGLEAPAAPDASMAWNKRFESLRLALSSLAYA
jgi:uncharacterized protein YndB with AHSA1/START domain